MGNTTHFSTKERILGAAEELFAQHGFAGTSLRQVTSRADVNIAAVNYHFGSKENLVNEVFRRRMDEMNRALAALPDNLKAPLLLASLEGRSHAEIAEVLGVTPKAIETRIARARQKLNQALAR